MAAILGQVEALKVAMVTVPKTAEAVAVAETVVPGSKLGACLVKFASALQEARIKNHSERGLETSSRSGRRSK